MVSVTHGFWNSLNITSHIKLTYNTLFNQLRDGLTLILIEVLIFKNLK